MAEQHELDDPLYNYDPEYTYQLAEKIFPLYEKYFRAEYKGFENIPDRNFLGVGNHGGAYYTPESMIWSGKLIMDRREPVMVGLTHSFAVDIQKKVGSPFIKTPMIKGEYKNAINVMSRGYSVMVYPGGDRETAKPFKERYDINFYNHKGYISLAIEAQVPILPVVSIGGHESVLTWWDGAELAEMLGFRKKFRLNVLPLTAPLFPLPAQITISVLPPVSTSAYSPDQKKDPEVLEKLNKEVLEAMQAEMDILAADRIPWVGKPKE